MSVDHRQFVSVQSQPLEPPEQRDMFVVNGAVLIAALSQVTVEGSLFL
jgi:hypothetical protein